MTLSSRARSDAAKNDQQASQAERWIKQHNLLRDWVTIHLRYDKNARLLLFGFMMAFTGGARANKPNWIQASRRTIQEEIRIRATAITDALKVLLDARILVRHKNDICLYRFPDTLLSIGSYPPVVCDRTIPSAREIIPFVPGKPVRTNLVTTRRQKTPNDIVSSVQP